MYQADISNKNGYTFDVKTKDYKFTVDTGGNGVSPPDALLVSLGSCIGVYIRKYAEGAKLKLEGFNIRVKGDFSKERPFCFRRIDVSIDLEGFEIDERRKKSLLDFIKNCPVHNTLKANPVINIALAK